MAKQYSWSDYSIAYGGRILEGCTGFEASTKKEKAFLYGRGDNPHEIVGGNKSYEGKIKLWQSEVERMISDAPNNDILKLRFNVTEAYVPIDGGQMVVNNYKGVEITELSTAFNQGDKNQIIELPVMYLSVDRQQ
ncbi:hypothetical protein PG913_08260 [Tenacibaculum pacificus]|uniref:hypothetical protein n=1 Tax=Tenacibaculum TaxID=104267 RepID=UPI0022F3A4A0|nr:hypothetical protein [Tenacibaculum pacificus]WBX72896.1 hypothetical protein PG913_08260 [Tenacibaculum pacificus]